MTQHRILNGRRVDLTEAEAQERERAAAAWISAAPIRAAAEARDERGRLLAASDWTQAGDAPLDAAARLAWATYRQALRDVTKQAGFPLEIDWPVAPGK